MRRIGALSVGGIGLAALAAHLLPDAAAFHMEQAARPVSKRLGGKSRSQRRKDERQAKAFKLKGIRP